MKKRLWTILIAMILMVSLLPVVSSASEIPVAEELPAESAALAANAEPLLTVEEAVLVIRENMKNRVNHFSVSVQATEAVENIEMQLYLLALAHTGQPTEGDYLQLHVRNYGMSCTPSHTDELFRWEIVYSIEYYTTKAQEDEMNAAIDDLIDRLHLHEDISDYQKLANIYDYLCSFVIYDWEHVYDPDYYLHHSAYAAMMQKEAVCSGYASLMYRLALEAGIDNRIITGLVVNADTDLWHAWNMVELDGVYYYADSTNDAGQWEYARFLKTPSDWPDYIPDGYYTSEEFCAVYPQAKTSYPLPDAQTYEENGFQYTVNPVGSATLISYNGTEADVVVPATLGGYPVYRIGRTCFFYNDSIKTLTFSEGICLMDQEPILSCGNLEEVHYPSTLKLPSYSGSAVHTGLSAVPVDCEKMHTISVAQGNHDLVVNDGVLYTGDMRTLLYLPPADPRTVLTVPEGVEVISSDACRDNANLEEVILPSTVTSIEYWAFMHDSNLKRVNIPENCTFIGQYAFQECAIESIHFPAATTTIVPSSFFGCLLESISMDPGNPYYYADGKALYMFDGEHTSLLIYAVADPAKEFTVPEGVGTLATAAFARSAHLEQIHLPDSLEAICSFAFYNCENLKSVTIPQGVHTMESHVFYGCNNLSSVNLSAELTTIPDYAFVDCYNLTSITIPGKVTEIGTGAFWACNALGDLVIPDSVTYIGSNAFYYCQNVESVTFMGNAPEICEDSFRDCTFTAYYDDQNPNWTPDVMQNYGGDITWMPIGAKKTIAKITNKLDDITVPAGEKVTVTVEAEGDGLTYQWYVKNVGGTKFSKSSITKATYSVTMSDAVNGRQVYCVVADQYGNTVTSNTVTLSQKAALKITKQPEDAYGAAGETVIVTVEAEGDGLTYEWYYKNASATKFSKTDAFTGNTYTVEMSASRDGRQIYCIITDQYGNKETTNTVTLNMKQGLEILEQPQDASAESGATVRTAVTASGDGLTYQWYIKNPTATKFAKSSVTGATYSCKMSDSISGRQAYCIITDQYGNKVQTDTVTLTMRQELAITKQPVSVSGAVGETVTVTVEAEGDGLTYEWYYKNAGGKKFTKTDAFTGNTYTVEMSAARNGRQIYCVVTDQYGNQETTNTVTLSMTNS